MSNTKASATLVTVHISTNLYMIFIFHYLLTYWFCKPSYTVSAVYVHESTCMTVYCHHLKYSYNFIPKNFFSIYRGPARGGSHVACLNLKRLVSVFINACRLLSALPSLLWFGRGRLSLVAISFYTLSLLFGPCCLLEFILAGPLYSHNYGSFGD